MKLAILGATHWVNRTFEACGNYQWAREFLKNALEVGATKIEFGIEWQAVEKFGDYRRAVSDNGSAFGERRRRFDNRANPVTAGELVRMAAATTGYGSEIASRKLCHADPASLRESSRGSFIGHRKGLCWCRRG